ncbi:Asp-tRNA(Asn)/Glu-tRNA(Gln) amidotransferase subunit GatA [Carboxydothermus pertinax]|uniref:Asp-tRNA(Asn)/Glu-tRNA(Gln) amidotransferase subunit GatA n=1 Tax=Carboxydothermus pertinax TaxID=870242 RepID=UPI00096AC14E|nr:Asp-tRNA(Asn)/Glu-tRNA(Gln) amidotransferase subunit GatA [Carboxydothermus pertinax]
MELYYLSAKEITEKIKAKEISAVEVAKATFDRIEAVEPKIQAYVTVTRELGLKMAREVDEKITRGEDPGPLAGVPVAIKDNMSTAGIRTTCSSKILESYIPPYDATVVEKLKAAGAVFTGKTNLDEFAMGSSTENSRFFPTKNPWDLERVPGGSSGGSAASVAAGEAVVSLGSDTGGSIRQPAAFCGIVGLKPTYGAVSRYGLVAFASSLDQIGPFARTVEDAALLLNVITGHDPKDSTSANVDYPNYLSFLNQDIKGLKIGLPKEYFIDGIDAGVKKAIDEAIKLYESLGAVFEEVSLPHTKYSLPVYYLIAPAEASSNLARYDGVRYGYRDFEAEDVVEMFSRTRAEGFGAEVKRRIMLGTYALSAGYYDAYYLKALKVRTLIKEDFDRAFTKVDLLLTPTTPTPAFKFGEKTSDPVSMYLSDIFTMAVNLAGLPGISVPAGFDGHLPVSFQLIGKPFDEGTLLKVAHAFEQNTEFHKARPKL